VAASGWISRIAYVRGSATLGLLLLVAANLIPIVGVLFLGWDVGLVLVAYWVENGIVGILNVPRILLASGEPPPRTQTPANAYGNVRVTNPVVTLSSGGGAGRAILAGFFLIHYGIFWFVHGVFLNVFLNLRGIFAGPFVGFGPGGFDPFRFLLADSTVLIAGLALFLSHLANLIVNYIGRAEYRTTSPGAQMFAPYPRMIALHVTIIVGGVAIMGLGQPVFAVALLVILKTIIDIGLYRFDRRRYTPAVTVNAQAAAPPEPATIV
jgi:hypothetical protein